MVSTYLPFVSLFSLLVGFLPAVESQTLNATSPPSNLPPTSPGVFTAQASILIDSPIDKAWDVLLNFTSYKEWNPFVRSQTVTDKFFIPTADQVPQEDLRLIINSQIPPLTPPVDASTPDNPLNTHITMENITHLQLDLHRVAWALISPSAILSAERWSALSVFVEDGVNKTFYESREVYNGSLASTVQALYGDSLNDAFQAQAVALKALLEG